MKSAVVVESLEEFVERARGEARCRIQVLDLEAPNRATVVLVAEAPSDSTGFVVYTRKLVFTPRSLKYWVRSRDNFEEAVLRASKKALMKLIEDIRQMGLEAGLGRYIYVFKAVY